MIERINTSLRLERINTTLRLEPQLLEALKIIAAHRRVQVNDLLLEGVRHVLLLHGDGET
jgi:predicted DNA-binding ribbon-helix-helix protein